MKQNSDANGPTAAIRRPEALRWIIVAAAAVMVAATLSVAARTGVGAPLALIVTLAIAAGFAWFGWSLATASASTVTFDGERLYDDAGVELCLLEEIEKVERGLSMFKPSSGFSILLTAPKERGWSPGLWWRTGRRIGVGGATPGRAGRFMADAIMGAQAARQTTRTDG